MSVTPDIATQALDWHVRMLGETNPEAWDALCAWLEASPDHAEAYERVAALDADLAAPLAAMPEPVLAVADAAPDGEPALPSSANDNEPDWRRRRRFAGWSAAAAGIAASFLLFVHQPGEKSLLIQTPDGQPSVTTLADGSVIHANGGSRLALSGEGHRTVQLLAGEASFTVRHDEAHPFAVMIGGHELRDVGTRFNVRRDGENFVLEVAEGQVALDPAGNSIAVGAGEALALAGDHVRRFAVAADQIGGWQRRRLSYDDAPVRQIAEDLTRMLGVPITVDPSAASKRYTGTILVPVDRGQAIQAIGLTLDLTLRPGNGGYVLTR